MSDDKTTDKDAGTGDKAENEAPRTGPDGKPMTEEIGGPKGPEPTRHGEWEINGRVVDF